MAPFSPAGPETGRLRLPRLLVSSSSGGGGKTLLSLGLARALRRLGHALLPLKKGPDYIDAAWLSAAAGRPASNLDPFFLDAKGLRAQLAHAAATTLTEEEQPRALALIEGNRGLYDGLDVEGTCSTATLARAVQAPVILTLNATKMTRTAAALLQGLVRFEEGLSFAGVVLNRTGGPRHAAYLRRSIERYTDLKVLGVLPRLAENLLPERHMGIASFLGDRLSETAERRLERLGDFIAENVDLDLAAEAARKAPDLPAASFWAKPPVKLPDPPVIGYVRDSCLWFYYRENLEALEREGATLARLSFFDEAPWPELDALYLGGGFPEDALEELVRSPRLAQLADLARGGLPVYAECGGLMVLARSLVREGRRFPMAGVLPVDIEICPRPQGLGYVQGTVRKETPFYPEGLELTGHEFHYSRALPEGLVPADACLGLSRGKGLRDGLDALVTGRTWGSYTHIFAPVLPRWAERLCGLALEEKKRRRA